MGAAGIFAQAAPLLVYAPDVTRVRTGPTRAIQRLPTASRKP